MTVMKGQEKLNMKGYSEILIHPGYGYGITVYQGEDISIETYWAGDSSFDSGYFGTGELSEEILRKYANSTAKDMMEELNIEGSILEHQKMD